MGVSSPHGRPVTLPSAPDAPAEVVWHDLECGTYRADLALWRDLAAEACDPPGAGTILDVGSGTGRVALELAAAGHRVIALDLSPALLRALAARRRGASVRTVCADARSFALDIDDLALCVVPMQTVQLLGGETGRAAFLARARRHMRPGALLACAIVTELEPFDRDAGEPGPSVESAHVGGRVYLSAPWSVRARDGTAVIERERRILSGGDGGTAHRDDGDYPALARDVIALDRVTAAELLDEGVRAGFTPAAVREIGSTEEHLGSTVVVFGA